MRIRQAHAHETGLVAQVLTSAAESLAAKGRPLWSPAEVSEAAVKEQLRAGTYYIAMDDQGPVGVFLFQLEDRQFWPEIAEGSSAYIHKLAVAPRGQGRGLAHALLRHACQLTREHGRRFLRLDCEAGRPKLSAVYERFGFRHHSEKVLGEQVFHRYEFEVGSADA